MQGVGLVDRDAERFLDLGDRPQLIFIECFFERLADLLAGACADGDAKNRRDFSDVDDADVDATIGAAGNADEREVLVVAARAC